jgi:hypothetical protein
MPSPKKLWPTIRYHWPNGKQGTMQCDPALVWTVARALQRDTRVYGIYIESKFGHFVLLGDGGIQVIKSDYFEQREYGPETHLAI